MLSQLFKQKLKLSPEPQYKIALRAGVHPGLLSKWVIGAQPVQRGDKRVLKIGRLLGLKPDQIFANKSVERRAS